MLRDIDADVVLGNDPENQVSAYLIAPGGQTMGYGSNYLTTGFTAAGVPVESPRRQLSLYTSNPIPGVWTLIIDFTSPVPGNELADPFTGRIRFNSVRWSRGELPGSAPVELKPGTVVHLPGHGATTPARRRRTSSSTRGCRGLASYTLEPQDEVSGLKLPLAASADPPEWIVPTMTHSVSVTATSSRPVMFDFGPFPGDPDEASTAGHQRDRRLSRSAGWPTPVTQGLWFAVPSEVGPYGAGRAAAATASMTMRRDDRRSSTPTASSPEGDFWKFGVASLAGSASYNLFTVNPGQTRTLTLTVRPSGKAGTVVRGILYVDDFVDSLQFLSGSQLVAIPYGYTIAG